MKDDWKKKILQFRKNRKDKIICKSIKIKNQIKNMLLNSLILREEIIKIGVYTYKNRIHGKMCHLCYEHIGNIYFFNLKKRLKQKRMFIQISKRFL